MRDIIRALSKPGDSGLFGRVMSAGFWAAAMRVVARVALMLRTIILAQILVPDDFGLMAIATLSILFVERFTETGIDSALVQRKGDIKPYLNTAWTMQILRSAVMAGALAIAAPLIAAFFHAPDVTAILRVLSLGVLLTGFTNIGVVYFIKELRFNRLFVLELSGKGVDVIVSIVYAVVYRNVWALVFGVLAGAVARFATSYVIHDYRPRLAWIWAYAKQLFNFGKWILASNALGYVTANLDDILVGRILGVQSLGWYRMAYNFSQAVATEVTQVTSQVAFPAYSKLQTAADRLRVAYLSTIHLVAFLGFPIAIGTILVANDLTFGVLGDQWAPIVVPMQILSIAGLVRGISATTSPLFQSQGRPDLPPRFMFADVIIVAVLLYPAINQFGLNGAAGVVVIAQTLTGLPALWLARTTVRATAREVVQAVSFPALNTALMVVAVVGVQVLFFDGPSTLSLVVLTLTGMLAYVGAVVFSTKLFGYDAPTDLLNRARRAAT